jgi:GT2 family glycosyltransferase
VDPSMTPELSIVIATCSRRATLPATLESLRRQTVDPTRHEVVVVVEGPSDDTRTPSVGPAGEPRWRRVHRRGVTAPSLLSAGG